MDERIEFLKSFSILEEIFKIDIEDDYFTVNDVEVGVKDGDFNWINTNTALGNIILLLRFLVNKN